MHIFNERIKWNRGVYQRKSTEKSRMLKVWKKEETQIKIEVAVTEDGHG